MRKHFVYLRRFTLPERELWLRDHAASHQYLAPDIAIPAEILDSLTRWEQYRARVEAVGLTRNSAVIVGESAAVLHGFPQLRTPSFVYLAYPGATSGRCSTPKTRTKQWRLPEHHWESVDGIRRTTFNRTLVDVVRTSDFVDGLVAMDHALTLKSRTELAKKFSLLKGMPGRKKIARALKWGSGASQSPLESAARALLLDVHSPLITSLQIQPEVRVSRFEVRYPDLLVNGWLAIEMDGDVKYREPTALLAEAKRQKALEHLGFQFLRFGYPDLFPPGNGAAPLVRSVLTILSRNPGRGPVPGYEPKNSDHDFTIMIM
ncbi:hypothetical protein WG915_06810 [Corynebacterium sp. H128]|uniref:hypothetical protein n=1 Tax=Corynebacterium sp. H128 TaxID=3133427 RepID=UPI0030A0C605